MDEELDTSNENDKQGEISNLKRYGAPGMIRFGDSLARRRVAPVGH
jgi:hypothetical protein